ncbi:GCN5 family acetyltransferase [Bifidobacterium italicum]|uniref:GCN5 family acetyltransferase n=1 Tax=Bifidobacterium italicum TaxID=1960968 RepID=A0A2A2EJZ1_9BIFI|nr:N-acetyltransferase [Bifidobacterium italicum]PAU69228.1 GCN5 family acetyltransferase [Bifidobacterium italicum]
MMPMFVRHATLDDLDALASIESACFPPKEAADIERLANRIETYPEHFWLLVNPDADASDACFPAHLSDGMLVSFINGMTTDDADLTDAMYEQADLHDEEGSWQMILGVDTAPVYQHRGCAAYLMRRVILDSAIAHRAGIVLACKEKLIGFYQGFGFVNEGPSASAHGNAMWYQMRLRLGRQADGEDRDEAYDITASNIRKAMEETTSYMDHGHTITAQFPILG